eukprot:807907_1
MYYNGHNGHQPTVPIQSYMYHSQQIMNNGHQSTLQQIITASQEHQQCLNFLKSRNFQPNTPLQQRQEIIQKIHNALTSKYKHNELQRRIQILRQCASYILQQTIQSSPSSHNIINPTNNNNVNTNTNTN